MYIGSMILMETGLQMRNFIFKFLTAAVLVVSFVGCGFKSTETSAPAAAPSKAPGSSNMQVGPGSGNGGKGVVIKGRLYLLDLVEAGIEKSPFFDETVQVPPYVRARVAQVFATLDDFPVDLVARKLAEIMSRNYAMGLLMLKTMELYRWRFVDIDLAPVHDQREGVKVQEGGYIQLAKRLSVSIIINRSAWKKMDTANRVALIFHESNYAFAKPFKLASGYFAQDVGAVQEFTAALFTKPREGGQNLYYAGARVYPMEFDFGGTILVNDHSWLGEGDSVYTPPLVFVNPEAEIYFARKDLTRIDGSSYRYRGFSLISEGTRQYLLDEAVSRMCSQLPQDAVDRFHRTEPGNF